jgi:hypothetical protein
MYKKPSKRGNEAYTKSPTFIYMTFCRKYKGRKIIKGSYPLPLMSKGERKIKSMKIGGAMDTGGV